MRPGIAVILALLLTAAIYAPVRGFAWVYEDGNAVWANASVMQGQPIRVDRARWLTALSHRIVFELSGRDVSPRWPHLVNLGLHLINGALVYALAGLFVAPWVAVGAAAMFLLHPMQVEAVAYVACRSELLAAAFALGACVVSLTARSWWQTVAAWLLVVAAICAKESAVVLVPLIAALEVAAGRRLSWGRIGALVVPCLVMAASVVALDYTSRSELGVWAYAATQATAVWRYLALIVVPVGFTVDHDFEIVAWPVRWLALGGLMALAGLPILAGLSLSDGDTGQTGRLWHRVPALRIVALGCAWFLIALAPRFVMRIPEVLNEHQLYLPSVGVWVVIAVSVLSGTQERVWSQASASSSKIPQVSS